MTNGEPMDWVRWHEDYADSDSDLSRRRRSVQANITTWLDSRPGEPLRVVSACAGNGRDIVEVLARRDDADRVDVVLLELNPELATEADELARQSGLDRVSVRQLDAGTTTSYVGAVPADLVMFCGVFGNIADEDIHATIRLFPQLCASDACVVWTRGRFRGAGDLTLAIRSWFAESGFEELAFDAPDDTNYRVGFNRFTGSPQRLEPDRTFFTFNR